MKSKLSLLVLAFLTACGGGGSSPSAPSTPFPTVTINTSASKVFTGESVKISWSSTNATTCNPIEGFAGVQPVSGELTFAPQKSGTYRYALSCIGDGRTASNAQVVTVEDAIQTFSGSQSPSLSTSANLEGNYKPTVGAFAFNTGLWGPKGALSYSFSMVGEINVKNSIINKAEFLWDVVASDTPQVVAYNNVTFGKHPGWTTSTSNKFPAQVGIMPTIKATGDVKTTCLTKCVFGSIMNMFVTATATPTYADVGTEFLIVTENSDGGPNPYIPGYVGQSTINGVVYNVYYNAIKSTWNNIGYSPLTQSSTVNVDVKDFMNDAIKRGYIKSTDYLQGVEVGTEVVFGKGKTTITNFSIN